MSNFQKRKYRREPEKCAELYKKEYDLLRYYVTSLKTCTLSDGSEEDFETQFVQPKHLNKIFRQDIYNSALVPQSKIKLMNDTVEYITRYRIENSGKYPEDINRYTLVILSKTYYVKVARDTVRELILTLERIEPIATSDYIYNQLEELYQMITKQVELRDWESWHMVKNEEQIDKGHMYYRNSLVRLSKTIEDVKNYDIIDTQSGRGQIYQNLVVILAELDQSRHIDTTSEFFSEYRTPMYITGPRLKR